MKIRVDYPKMLVEAIRDAEEYLVFVRYRWEDMSGAGNEETLEAKGDYRDLKNYMLENLRQRDPELAFKLLGADKDYF